MHGTSSLINDSQDQDGMCWRSLQRKAEWGFPKLGVHFWGVSIIRIPKIWCLYWGPHERPPVPKSKDQSTFGEMAGRGVVVAISAAAVQTVTSGCISLCISDTCGNKS